MRKKRLEKEGLPLVLSFEQVDAIQMLFSLSRDSGAREEVEPAHVGFIELLEKLARDYRETVPGVRIGKCIDGILASLETDNPMRAAWFGFMAGLDCRTIDLVRFGFTIMPTLQGKVNSIEGLEHGRTTIAKNKAEARPK